MQEIYRLAGYGINGSDCPSPYEHLHIRATTSLKRDLRAPNSSHNSLHSILELETALNHPSPGFADYVTGRFGGVRGGGCGAGE